MRYLTINWFADAPVVEISPTNLTAIEGEEVMILCTYDSNPSLLTAVRWCVSVFSILEFSCVSVIWWMMHFNYKTISVFILGIVMEYY